MKKVFDFHNTFPNIKLIAQPEAFSAMGSPITEKRYVAEAGLELKIVFPPLLQ